MFIAASLLLAAAVGCANVPEEQALEEYNTRTTALVEDFNSQVAALQADSTLSAEEMSAKMQEAYDAVSAELVSDGLEMIRKYPSGTLAVTVLQNTANVMEESQLAEALGMLEGAALEDEYVKSLVALNDAKQATAEGKMFTDFTVVQDPADSLGSKVSLSDFVGKGKYVLVDFWASWCGPCKAEIPNIAAVYEKYKGEDFDVLSIAVWDDPADTKVSYGTTPQTPRFRPRSTESYGTRLSTPSSFPPTSMALRVFPTSFFSALTEPSSSAISEERT